MNQYRGSHHLLNNRSTLNVADRVPDIEEDRVKNVLLYRWRMSRV